MTNEEAQAAHEEVERLTDQGRYAEATERTLVYHHGSVNTSQGGVRLSFAMSDWYELGQKYSPAMDALRQSRDEAREEVLRAVRDCSLAPDLFEYFHDFASMNDALGEEDLTAELFMLVEVKDSERAGSLYHVAEPALVRGRHFRHCNKYLDPERDFASAAERLLVHREFESQTEHRSGGTGDAMRPKFADGFFAHEMTTLIALLAVNGRNQEAATIASKAKIALPDKRFHSAVDKALQGHVPEPWP